MPAREARSVKNTQLSGLHTVVFCTGMLACTLACADVTDVFLPYADYSLTSEDNLLRLHDSDAALQTVGTTARSDSVRRMTIGLKINQFISEQKFSADISVNRNTYNRFTQFDNDGKDALGNWNWHVGKYLEGNLTGSYSQALAPQEDFRIAQRNVRVQRRKTADITWRLHPSWRLRGGYSEYDLSYELASQRFYDRRLGVTELGIDYLASSFSTIGVQLRRVNGDYPHPQILGSQVIDNSFVQDELKSKVYWEVTRNTRFQFLGGWVQKKFNLEKSRDFNGINARLNTDWMATNAVLIRSSVWREVAAVNDLAANYALNRGASLEAGWEVSSKVRLGSAVRAERRDFNGIAILAGVPTSNRTENFKEATLGLTYSPFSHAEVGVSIFRDILISNFQQFSFGANGAKVSFRYDFGK